jgi:cytochrome c oxidase subunit 2
MRKNGRHLAIVAVLVAIGTVVTYYLLTSIYQLPEAASQQAVSIDQLFGGHFLFISFFFALIVVFALYVVFRRKPGDEEMGAQFHGNTPLEIAWTVIPLIIVIGFGIWGYNVLRDVTSEKADEMTVKVTGQQWKWGFEYPDYPDMGSVSEMVLPVNQPVVLQMESIDVLHSFWVPEFRVKQDLLPGRVTTLRITPTEINDFKTRCAEICGTQHSLMLATVSVRSRADFEAWVTEMSTSFATMSPEERGARWSAQFGCNSCHSIDGSALAGPTWLDLFGSQVTLSDGSTVTADNAYLHNSMMDPASQVVEGFSPIMPSTFSQQFADEQARLKQSTGVEFDIAADLMAYIQSLSSQQ